MFISPAFAQTTAGAGSFIEAAAPLVLVFGILYFFLIRPQQKRVKEHQAMITAVRRGDTVVTAGGIVGKVTKVQEDGELLIEIADGVRVRVITSTLTAVRAKGEPAAETK
ncbi:MAG: preprotein translocase subunit YajC [Alphaproteobacteria bacterium]|nr:preprotein translocase subunit YajC [Alphaproteobacteria bacterium]